MHRRARLLSALLAAGILACPGPRIVLEQPRDGLIVDDPAPVVPVAARIAPAFDPLTVEVRLDGVDLIGALGLVPPFAGEAGTVDVGGDLVNVAAFTYTTSTTPRRVELELADLPPGPHQVQVFGTKSGGGSQLRTASIRVVGAFAGAGDDVPSAALSGVLDFAVEGVLVNAGLGGPLASAPVPLADGGELRAGFVPVAEARIEGATP